MVSSPKLLSNVVVNTLNVNSVGYEIIVYKNITKLTQGIDFNVIYSDNILNFTFINGNFSVQNSINLKI